MSKLRVQWRTPRPTTLAPQFEAQVFAQVCALQPTRPGLSQDETLIFEVDAEGAVRLEYVFDHDFASQYDQTERWGAMVREGPRLEDWRGPF